jgi:heterotetrameric sarcosine oxidase gamma subunit
MTLQQFEPYKVSGAYRAQAALHAKWIEIDGWRVAETFGIAEDEAARVRRSAGLEDVSPLGKLDVKGTGIDLALPDCERLDGVRAVIRQKPGHAIVVTGGPADRTRDDVERVFARAAGCAHVTDVTSGLAAFALVGPRAADVLAGLTSIDLRTQAFANGASAPCTLAHVHTILSRGDWGDLRAYLLLVGRDASEHVWTTVLHAGERVGLTPFGVAAEQLLHAVDGFSRRTKITAFVMSRHV